jgi:hypothetical protein
MNHDMVFWSVIICVAGSFLVPAWLLLRTYLNAIKKDKQQK